MYKLASSKTGGTRSSARHVKQTITEAQHIALRIIQDNRSKLAHFDAAKTQREKSLALKKFSWE